MRPFSLSVALTLGVAATAYAQGDTRQVSGHLIYLPRIALPEDAEVTIVAQGAFDAELDQLRYQTEGQQVPLPFVLDVPRDISGTISAVIRVADEPMWLVRDIGFLAGGVPVDLGDLQLESYTALAFASRFDCGGTEVQFGVVDDDAVLRVHDVDYKMVEAIAASGARYVSEGDDSTEFWSKGNSAMVTAKNCPSAPRSTIPPRHTVPAETSRAGTSALPRHRWRWSRITARSPARRRAPTFRSQPAPMSLTCLRLTAA